MTDILQAAQRLNMERRIESLQNQVNDLIEQAEAADRKAVELSTQVWGRLTAHGERIVKLAINVGRTGHIHSQEEQDWSEEQGFAMVDLDDRITELEEYLRLRQPVEPELDPIDDLYLCLHGARESLCLAQMAVASKEIRDRIENVIAAIDGAGWTACPQWSKHDNTHIAPKAMDARPPTGETGRR